MKRFLLTIATLAAALLCYAQTQQSKMPENIAYFEFNYNVVHPEGRSYNHNPTFFIYPDAKVDEAGAKALIEKFDMRDVIKDNHISIYVINPVGEKYDKAADFEGFKEVFNRARSGNLKVIGIGNGATHKFAVRVSSSRPVLSQIVAMVAVTLHTVEKQAGNTVEVALDESARKAGPIRREIFPADDIGMRAEVDERDILCALAPEAQQSHGVVTVRKALDDLVASAVGVTDDRAVGHQILADEGDRLVGLSVRDPQRCVLHIIDCHLRHVAIFAVEALHIKHVVSRVIVSCADVNRGVLMQRGEENMLLGDGNALRDLFADHVAIISVNTDEVRNDEKHRLLPVVACDGIELDGVKHSLCKARIIISRKIRSEGWGDVNS